jgi:peptidoglycan/LPS O-acetylase OafA/YrhL
VSVEGFSRYGARSIAPLDGLRAVAALSVLSFHVYNTTAPNWAAGGPPPVRWFVSNLGQNGVSCFFVLSAFLLGMPFLRAVTAGGAPVDLGRYARARLLRLFPAWWLVLGVMAVLWRPWVLHDPGALAQYALLQQNYDPRLAQHVVAQGWTLGIEISFYLLLPLLAVCLSLIARRLSPTRRPPAILLLLAGMLVASYLAQRYLVSHQSAIGIERANLRRSLIEYGDRFVLGLLCAFAFIEMRRRGRFPRAAALGSGAALVYTAGVWLDQSHRENYAAAASALVLLGLAVGERSTAGRALGSPVMRLLGRLSYGIYLWHLPLKYFGATLGLFPGRTPWATIPCIAGLAAASTACAYVSYVVVERPALRLVDRWPARRPVAVAFPEPALPAAADS